MQMSLPLMTIQKVAYVQIFTSPMKIPFSSWRPFPWAAAGLFTVRYRVATVCSGLRAGATVRVAAYVLTLFIGNGGTATSWPISVSRSHQPIDICLKMIIYSTHLSLRPIYRKNPHGALGVARINISTFGVLQITIARKALCKLLRCFVFNENYVVEHKIYYLINLSGQLRLWFSLGLVRCLSTSFRAKFSPYHIWLKFLTTCHILHCTVICDQYINFIAVLSFQNADVAHKQNYI